LAVVRVGGLQVGLVGLRGDLAEEAEAISNFSRSSFFPGSSSHSIS
jgi:hypothetical protein